LGEKRPVTDATIEKIDGLPGVALIAQTLDGLRQQRGSLEGFLEAAFGAMEDLAARLTSRQNELHAREALLEERQRQISAQHQEQQQLKDLLELQAGRLETLASELQNVRSQLLERQDGGVAGVSSEALNSFVAKLEEQRDDLKQRLDVCREELARRADNTERLATTQAELSRARAEILELRDRLAELHDAGRADLTAEQERIALETELELVRRRAAELSESLAEQKDQWTQQQSMLSLELRNLRQLLDSYLSTSTISPPASYASAPAVVHPPQRSDSPAQAPHAAERPAEAQAAAAAPANPVVDSIMEQFSKLQKDVAQRRKRKTT
jgi:chromosome segregation ATPase